MGNAKKIYEFETYCPWEECERGILFNRNVLNKTIKCPNCFKPVYLCLPDIQKPGMEHIQKLKAEAVALWVKKDQKPSEWAKCVDEVMMKHRRKLMRPGIYDNYRPDE